eukprot:CAMPEP_0119521140 /NCGR_PEP_ID=MMETSP1344-20130328/36941_1 /TAXON_ID=236787 /ORGANISM="Florenciella parvula, Strain CCMP2471" /LENGTH=228 /DNA_ID=CAMNT_0007559091 /DNA_START=129 /DNA_END=815 /DNA_ORIENTATION=-
MASNGSSTEATDTAAQTPPTAPPSPSSDLTKQEEGMLAAAWEEYRRLLVEKPVQTKAVSAGVIAAVGEIIGGSLRVRAPNQKPSRARSVGAFFLFGLVVNGPFFHWWYGTLEKMCKGMPSNSPSGLASRLALDRFIMTPPFLVTTLAGLHFLQHLDPKGALKHMRMIFWGALVMNWKVWTAAQAVNFTYVPVKFRPLFGSVVALWWNIYLSMSAAKGAAKPPLAIKAR